MNKDAPSTVGENKEMHQKENDKAVALEIQDCQDNHTEISENTTEKEEAENTTGKREKDIAGTYKSHGTGNASEEEVNSQEENKCTQIGEEENKLGENNTKRSDNNHFEDKQKEMIDKGNKDAMAQHEIINTSTLNIEAINTSRQKDIHEDKEEDPLDVNIEQVAKEGDLSPRQINKLKNSPQKQKGGKSKDDNQPTRQLPKRLATSKSNLK